MRKGLGIILAIFPFFGGLLTELVERRIFHVLNLVKHFFSKTVLSQVEVLHQQPWWIKTVISLLGLAGLGWVYFY